MVTILVIEDTPLYQELIGLHIGNVFQGIPCELKTAYDAVSALENLEKRVYPYDLILTDCDVPKKGDGKLILDTLKNTPGLKEKYANTPIVLLSSHGDVRQIDHYREKFKALGFNEFFSKSRLGELTAFLKNYREQQKQVGMEGHTPKRI